MTPRTRLLAALCTLAITPAAFAQDTGQEDQAPAAQQPEAQPEAQPDQGQAQPSPAQQAPEGQGADVTPQQQTGQVNVPKVAGAKEEAPGEVHTVVKGDTLWDLSSTYLGSPWYWPKVWSYNPQIANPHWIYPGNQIRFFPAGEEGPARVEVATPEGQVGGGEEEEATVMGDELDEGKVTVAGKIGYEPPKTLQVEHQGFLTQRQIAESGVISHSESGALMLSFPATVYMKFNRPQEAKVGDTYVVFRTVKKVSHPITGADFGYLTDIIGTIRVTGLSKNYVIGQIAGSTDEIRRGDRVGPYGEPLNANVNARPNDRSLNGYVLAMLEPSLTMAGEMTDILVDKGSAEGVQLGNTFTVVRQSDPIDNLVDPSKHQDASLPIETVATCIAVDVKEHATTCLITDSISEVVPGDRAEMRPAGVQVGLR